MVQASVGFQCPECTHARPQRTVPTQTLFRGHDEVVAGKVLIAANVVVYLLVVVTGGEPMRAVGPVFEQGALFGPFVADGEFWRIVTSGFLHNGLLHLGMNMFLLWLLAQELEPVLGRVGFCVLYFMSLVGGSVGALVLTPFSATIGASGAVYGLMGALIVLQLRAKQNPWRSGIAGLVLINLLFTITVPGVSLGGHLGGLLAGAAGGAILQPLQWPQEGAALRTTVVSGLGFVLFWVAVAAATTFTTNPLF